MYMNNPLTTYVQCNMQYIHTYMAIATYAYHISSCIYTNHVASYIIAKFNFYALAWIPKLELLIVVDIQEKDNATTE